MEKNKEMKTALAISTKYLSAFESAIHDLEKDINQHAKSHLEEILATVKNMETLDAIKEEFIYEKIIQLINFQIEKLK